MYMNPAQNQEKSQSLPQTSPNIQLEATNALNILNDFDRAFISSIYVLTVKYGIARPSTALLQKFGAGCRDTQLKSRRKLLGMGLLKQVLNRVKKGTRKNLTNLYFLADWLLDESLRTIFKIFCKTPWYAPIRSLSLWSNKPVNEEIHQPPENTSSSDVDSILKGYYINIPFFSQSSLIFEDSTGPFPSLRSIKGHGGQSTGINSGGNTPCVNPNIAQTPEAHGKQIDGLGFINKTGEKRTEDNTEKNLQRESRYEVLRMKPVFQATAEESSMLIAARATLKQLPKMKNDRIAVGLPLTAEKERVWIDRQISSLTSAEIEILKKEGLC